MGSPSGTEGIFKVHLDGRNEKIAEIYWDCPYIGGNKLQKRYAKADYDISDGFSPLWCLGQGKNQCPGGLTVFPSERVVK